jgi:putative transposase
MNTVRCSGSSRFSQAAAAYPSSYYEVLAKRTDVDRLSARARNDMAMKIEIRRVFNENFQVYGVRKVWRQLQREGFDIARLALSLGL